GRAPELQLTSVVGAPSEPRPMAIPGVLAGATVANRWQDEQVTSAWRNLMDPGGTAARESGSVPQQPAPTPADASSGIRPMIPLGQFRDTFIIAIDDEGISIVDQHVA